MLKFLLALAVLAVANASFLVANYYTDVEACASGLSAQAYIPMGKCITLPEIPPSLDVKVPVKSFKSSCTQNADGSIETSNKGYATSSSCSGVGVPIKQSIPAGCSSGGTFQCVPDMTASDAIAKGWPAVGAYFGDSACGVGNWDVQAAFAPDTCVTLSGKKGTGSVIATATADSLSVQGWNGATTCDGTPSKTYELLMDTCQIVDMPSLHSDEERSMYYSSIKAFHHLFSTVMNLEVEPKLIEWLEMEMAKADADPLLTGHMLNGAPPIYSKAGVAGKL
jgi:hypothetical protein